MSTITRAASAQRLAVQEGVDLGIGDAVGSLVRMAGAQVLEVGGGDLLHQVLRSAEGAGEGAYLMLGQAAERSQVAGAVAELVKNPMTASAAWSVPITRPPRAPAMAYWATMRMRALILPMTKSLFAGSSPSRASSCSARAFTDGPMLTVCSSSARMVASEAWASASSCCTW